MSTTTFFATFLDLQNALGPRPGDFDDGGHDYRRETHEVVRTVFSFQASDEQMERVQQALQHRELMWETERLRRAAPTAPSRSAKQPSRQSSPRSQNGEAKRSIEQRSSRW
jgi:hypothetical protein